MCVAEMPRVADDWGLIDEWDAWYANARAIAAVPEMIEALGGHGKGSGLARHWGEPAPRFFTVSTARSRMSTMVVFRIQRPVL